MVATPPVHDDDLRAVVNDRTLWRNLARGERRGLFNRGDAVEAVRPSPVLKLADPELTYRALPGFRGLERLVVEA